MYCNICQIFAILPYISENIENYVSSWMKLLSSPLKMFDDDDYYFSFTKWILIWIFFLEPFLCSAIINQKLFSQ